MSNNPTTTQSPTTTQQSKSDASLEFTNKKSHVYIKNKNENDTIKRESIYNIDITRSENIKKLSTIDSKITENQNANTMINMKPANENIPVYINFDIKNLSPQSFSGSFYVSFNTELFDSNEDILLGRINTPQYDKKIIFNLKKHNNEFYLNAYNIKNNFKKNDVLINNFKSKQILTFLVLFKYIDDKLHIGINDKDDVIIIDAEGIVVSSLTFGDDYGGLREFTSNTKHSTHNCYIGGIRFYNTRNSFNELRTSAYFKAPPEPDKNKTTATNPDGSLILVKGKNGKNNTTDTKLLYDTLTIRQGTLVDTFINYSPSAQLFKNI